MKKNSFKALEYLPLETIKGVIKGNRAFMSKYKEEYISLESIYKSSYNLETRQKLQTIDPILVESSKYFIENRDEISQIIFPLVYGKIINNILFNNKISTFKYEITNSTNFTQLIAIIQEMKYPKGVIFTISDPNFTNINFKLLLLCIKSLKNVIDFTVYVKNNFIGFARNAKKFTISQKEKETQQFLEFKNMLYETFKEDIEFLWLNFEDFEDLSTIAKNDTSIYRIKKCEINLSFKNKVEEFKRLMKYLSHKIKAQAMKILLFQTTDFESVIEFIKVLQPTDLWLIPYQDVPDEFSDKFLSVLNSSCKLTKLNIINITGFSASEMKKFVESQTDIEDLRICGNISEEVMETILTTYLNDIQKFKIKIISLNGRIVINEKWKNIICSFLKIPTMTAFHLDGFFNGTEYMRDIALAFFQNTTLNSFAVRNSVRHERDTFVDVLKEVLYEQNIPRKEVFNKIRKYKLI